MITLILLAGCGGGADVPKTFPVQGKVVFKGKGGSTRTLVGGLVRLQSLSDPSLRAAGEIEEGGSFSISIYVKGTSLSGVPAGEYRVAVEPPVQEADDEGRPRRPPIHAKYRDFAKSGLKVTVPVEGEVVFPVEATGR